MQIKVPPGNIGDHQEAREQRLLAFAAAGIERFSTAGADTGMGTILAVARSADSPVVRALAALRSALADSRMSARLVLSDDDVSRGQLVTAETGTNAGYFAETRIIRDSRLRDAHEQLIVGPASVWFGDCLRRDAHRRDLFEQYFSEAPEIARSAANGFEHLWSRAEPCLAMPALVADSLASAPNGKPGNTGPAGNAPC